MGRRPYKIRKNNPTVPTCWRSGENLHSQNIVITERLLDPVDESVDHADFPLDNDIESDHISSGSGTRSMSLDDQGSVTSSTTTTSNSSSSGDCNGTTQDPYRALPNPHCPLDHCFSFHDMVETVDDDEEEDTNQEEDANPIHVDLIPPPSLNDNGFISGPSLRLGIELLNLCSHAKVPLDFYEQVLRLFRNYAKTHIDDDHDTTWKTIPSTRDKLLNQLKAQIPCVIPHCYAVPSTHDIVPKFGFMDQLIDLFSTPYFQDMESCCFNLDETSRFLKYQPPPEEGLSELLGAQWYQETYDMKIGDNPIHYDPDSGKHYHNLLCPVVLYNDKISVSAMEGSYSLEPLMFSLGLLRRKTREKDSSWRHLGFIPCRSSKKKQKHTVGHQAEQALAFTHECLSILLADIVAAQQEPPLLNLNLFGKNYNIRLILEVAFVIGDQLSQDTHCCRKKSNSGGAGRAHRSCLTSSVSADKTPPKEGCQPISKKVLDSLCSIIWEYEDTEKRNAYLSNRLPAVHTKRLKQKVSSVMKLRSQIARDILEKVFSLYPVNNAWSKVSFGSNQNGIHTAAVDDPMHYNSSGLFSYLGKIAFGGLQPSEAETLEGFMREDFMVRSSVRYDLPRGKFTSGFTNCTLLTSNEKVGIMYALYLSLDTPRVADIYRRSILRQQQKYEDLGSDSCSLPKVDDQYFFKHHASDPIMPRTNTDVRKMMKSLNTLGLLSYLEEVIPSFDQLQTEYLLQSIWDRLGTKDPAPMIVLPEVQLNYPVADNNAVTKNARCLHQQLRQRNSRPPLETKRCQPSCVQTHIEKHWCSKPKVKGNGDTSCILTDVKGFRDVLHSALVFHALVHEFHELDPEFHANLPELKLQLEELLSGIYSRIYRGDNSVDVRTCKCHAHFHLTWAIKYFGPCSSTL